MSTNDTPTALTDALFFDVFGSTRIDWTPNQERAYQNSCALERRALAAEAKLAFLKEKGLEVGWLKDGHGERWAYVIEPDSEMCDLKHIHKVIDAEKAQRDAEARLREVEAIIETLSDLEISDEGFWNNQRFILNCNDVFVWGCADGEPLEVEDIPALKKAHEDCIDHGTMLHIARKRQMRPQGAMYAYIHEGWWPLFDACGPSRESTFGNPIGTEGREAYSAKKKKEQEDAQSTRHQLTLRDQQIERLREALENAERELRFAPIHMRRRNEWLAAIEGSQKALSPTQPDKP